LDPIELAAMLAASTIAFVALEIEKLVGRVRQRA
jgi:hypothetical protein